MKRFTSLDLQQRSGEIQRSALSEPVIITNHGNPRFVMLSGDEFKRLKHAAGEPVPPEMTRRKTIVQRGLPPDALGRDTSDFEAFVLAVAEHALSGRDQEAIDQEIQAAERRLGIRREQDRV